MVEVPYWYLSYRSAGFVRRGLLGTLTAPLLFGRPIENAVGLASFICLATTLVVIIWLARDLGPPASENPLTAAAVVAFAASPALMMLCRDLGLLDIFLVAAIIMAVSYLTSGKTTAATIICAVAPLIHEAFVFFGLPILVGAAYVRRDRRCVAPVLAMLACTAIIWFGATRNITWPPGIPIPKQGLDAFAARQLGQAAGLMGWPRPNSISVVVLSALSIAVSGAAAWYTLDDARYGIATIFGGLLTASIVALATDADRFIAWAPVTSLIMLIVAANFERRQAA